TLEDMEGTVEVTVFPEPFKTAAACLRSGEAVLVRGGVDGRDKGGGVPAEDVRLLEQAPAGARRRPRRGCRAGRPDGRRDRRAARIRASPWRPCAGFAASIPDACPCSCISCSMPRKSSSGPAAFRSTPAKSWSPRVKPLWAPARSAWTMPDALDFEQPLIEIEIRIAGLQAQEATQKTREEIAKLEDRLSRLRQKTYASLTAWQRTQLARHPKRPHTRDLFKLLFDDFVELHGDRVYG